MEKQTQSYETIDEYIALFPTEIGELLESIRKVIREEAPDAAERISYRMPAFDLQGPLVYFAAFKDHIGFFPTASGIEAFRDDISEYGWAKGTVRFPLGKPVPYDLIRRIVRFKAEENRRKAEAKPKRKK